MMHPKDLEDLMVFTEVYFHSFGVMRMSLRMSHDTMDLADV